MLRTLQRCIKSERTRMRKAVEHCLAFRDSCCGGTVIFLVKEETRLLTVLDIDVIFNSVLGYLRDGEFRMRKTVVIPALVQFKPFLGTKRDLILLIDAVDIS